MKTFFLSIIPRIKEFSKKLDDISLLTGQHWVVIDEILESKSVYIFRPNNQLLISKNGIVKKARWDYIGNNSILIDIGEDSYLFNHGFLDENILALRLDGGNEFFILLNQSRFHEGLNNIQKINEFLTQNYIIEERVDSKNQGDSSSSGSNRTSHKSLKKWISYKVPEGLLEVEIYPRNKYPWNGDKVKLNSMMAADGKYKIGFMNYLVVEKGHVKKSYGYR